MSGRYVQHLAAPSDAEEAADAIEMVSLRTKHSSGDDDPPPAAAAATASYWRRLLDVCGWRFLAFLAASQAANKGALMTVIGAAMLPLFRNSVDASTLQIYSMIVMLPWSLKPLIGLCSDYVLVGGYHKRGWLLLGQAVGLISSIALFVLSLVRLDSTAWPAALLVACFGALNFQVSLYDLLSEAKYSELRNAHPEVGSDITTLAQGMIDVGALLALLCAGLLADARAFTLLFAIAMALAATTLLPTLLGWLPEERIAAPVGGDRKFVAVSPTASAAEWPLVAVVAFCGLSSVVVVALEELPLVGLGVSFVLLTCCLAGAWRVFSPLLVRVALFQVLTTAAQPSVGTALSYYYTANATCVPDGPHFDYAYFISWTGMVGTALSLAGVFVYQLLLSRLRFRRVLLITTVLVGLAGLSDLSMVLRWNVALGVPDRVAYMLGEAIVEPLLGKLSWIPVSALIALAAEPGREACSFAFMAGIANFARMQARLAGAVITAAAGVGVGCHFGALWWLVLLCHIVFPLLVGVPAVWLVPDMEQNERRQR